MTESEGSLDELQLKTVVVAAEMIECRASPTEAAEEQTVLQADALQFVFRESTREKMDTRKLEIKTLQDGLLEKRYRILQLTAEHVKLTDKSGISRSQKRLKFCDGTPKVGCGSLWTSIETCQGCRRCKGSSDAPSVATFLALHARRDNFKKCFGALPFVSKCIASLAPQTKRLRDNMSGLEKTDAVAKKV